MAVPNTTTFTLQNVVDNVAGAASDLSSCFTNSNSPDFNATYGNNTPPNNMLEFRDYNEGGFSLTLDDNGINTSSSAGNVNVTVTSNTTWTVSSNAGWLTFSGNANTGNDTFNVAWTANASGVTRTGTITVAWSGTNRTYVVQQNP